MDMQKKAMDNLQKVNPFPGLYEMQKKAMETIAQSAEGAMGVADKSQKMMDNAIKYQKAYVNYQQSILEMMEAMNDNINLMRGKDNEQ
jgi:hypothetical protein